MCVHQGPSPLRKSRNTRALSEAVVFLGSWRVFLGFWRVFFGSWRVLVGFCCYEGVVTVVVTRAVTRVEQKVIEAANVSLLALYKEGKSDPDPPPWTPAIHHPSSTTNRVPHVRLGTKPATIVRCRIAEHALPPTGRYTTELSPPPCLSPRLRGSNKNSGFLFILCVCLRVGPSLSRSE